MRPHRKIRSTTWKSHHINVFGSRKEPFSRTSKMPWLSFNLPAEECKTGSVLKNNPKSMCSDKFCYVKKQPSRYNVKTVKNALYENFNNIENDGWADSFIYLLKEAKEKDKDKKESNYFRWFDAGDIQSKKQLSQIAYIAYEVPDIDFWVSTHEFHIVQSYVRGGSLIPENLRIRISDAEMEQDENEHQKEIDVLNKKPNVKCNITTSGVSGDDSMVTCISSQQGNVCFGDKKKCTDCWTSNKRQVYKLH